MAMGKRKFFLSQVFGKGKKWYALSSISTGRKISQFVKGKFWEAFPSEICHVRLEDLWRENGEDVPPHWFASKSLEEGYVISLFGLCSGLIKQYSSQQEGF